MFTREITSVGFHIGFLILFEDDCQREPDKSADGAQPPTDIFHTRPEVPPSVYLTGGH